MSDKERLNLDRLAAKYAQAITNGLTPKEAGDMDNTVTKALGVLQENGLYACMLYLLSRTQDKEKKIAAVVCDEMLNLLGSLGFEKWAKPAGSNLRSETILAHVAEITADKKLERLLLAKETLEQMLIYARYGAKARKAEGG